MTTIPAEPKKRHRLTQEDCDTARLLMARQRTLKEIAEIIDVDPSTVGKIRLADYNLEKYLEQRKVMNKKTKEKKKMMKFVHAIDETLEEQGLQQLVREAAGGIAKGVEQVAGQLQMDLPKAEGPCARSNTVIPREHTLSDLWKKMDERRFQAALMDKLLKKLDELIDVLKGGGSHE